MEICLQISKELAQFTGNSFEEMQANLDGSKRWTEKLQADLVQFRDENASFLDLAVSILNELTGKK